MIAKSMHSMHNTAVLANGSARREIRTEKTRRRKKTDSLMDAMNGWLRWEEKEEQWNAGMDDDDGTERSTQKNENG